jgi:hypothetical protein
MTLMIRIYLVSKVGRILSWTSSLFLLLHSQAAWSQNITGTTSICPGTSYTYTFDPGSYCRSTGPMSCIGCDQNTVLASNNSISLVWLPGQISYSVSVPTSCKEPDSPPSAPPVADVFTEQMNPTDLRTPNFICPSANSTFYEALERQVPLNDSGC